MSSRSAGPWLLLFALGACSSDPEAGAGPTPDAVPDTGDAAEVFEDRCPIFARVGNSECCPAGSAWDTDAEVCVEVGPPECATTLHDDPAACVPRWCWDWATATEESCEPGELGCHPWGRRCTPDELAGQGGCPAGHLPDGSGGCRDLTGALERPPVPTPRWCWDVQTLEGDACSGPHGVGCVVRGRRCGPDELAVGCDVAESPGPFDEACRPAAGPAHCPTAFMPDPEADPDDPMPPCVPDPAACPEGKYSYPAGNGRFFVDVSATDSPGEGTEAKPYTSIAEAMALMSPKDGVLLLAPGVYEGPLFIETGMQIFGTCPAKTIIRAATPDPLEPVVRFFVDHGEPTLGKVTLEGERPGIVAQGNATLVLDEVWIPSAVDLAIITGGMDSVVRDTYISDVRAKPGGARGDGIVVEGGRMDIKRSRISGAITLGIQVWSGATLDAFDVVIDRTLGNPAVSESGTAIAVAADSSLVLAGSRLHGNTFNGVAVYGGTATIVGTLIDRTGPGPYNWGVGLQANQGDLALIASRIDHSVAAGVSLEGGDAQLAEVTIAGVVSHTNDPTETTGFGVDGFAGARISAERLHVFDAEAPGVAVAGIGSSLLARDVGVWDGEVGLQLLHGARADLSDVRLAGNAGAGIVAGTATTRVLVSGVQSADPVFAIEGSPLFGVATAMGLQATLGAKLDVFGASLSGGGPYGMVAAEGGAIRAVGVRVSGAAGPGILAGAGATAFDEGVLELVSTIFADNIGVGVYYDDAAGTVEGVVIDAQTKGRIATNAGEEFDIADGLLASGASDVVLSDAILIDNVRAGALAAAGASLRATGVLSTRNDYGLALTGGGTATLDRTVIRGNSQQDFAGDVPLPVPKPPDPIPPPD